LFVASEKALYIVNIITGRAIQRFPKDAAEWPENEGPGNLVITGDHVIVAGARAVNVYTDLASVRQKYESAIASDPNNVEARLVYGELMFNARELKETRKALDEAIVIMGGLNSMRPGPLRDRAFSDALMFAQKLGAEKSNESIALAEELFNRAGAAAGNPSQKVNYRLSRARFIEGLKEIQTRPDYAKAVRLYQEILSDPEMRIITLAGEDASGTLQAGKLAENAINDLVRKVDRSIYDELEKEAAEKLAKLGAQGNPDELMALAENYPNSKVASDALMLAAKRYEDTNKPRMATQVLRRLNWKYNYRFTAAERGALIEAMARNYLKVGNLGAALGRLQKGNSLLPDEKLRAELVLPDGKALSKADGKAVQTIGEAADALQEIVQKSAAAAVPDAHIPLPPTMQDRLARKPIQKPFDENPVVFAGVQAMLESPVELLDRMRTDRIVTWANRKITCFNPGGKEPRWVSDAVSDNALGIAWLDAKLMAWGESEVALVDGDSGKTTWRVDIRALPAVDLVVAGGAADGPTPNPAGGGAAGAVAQQEQIQADMVRMQMMRRRVRPGFVVELPAAPEAVAGAGIAAANNVVNDGKERVLHVRPLTDRVIVSTTTGRVLALNIDNGRLIWQTRLATGRQIQQTLATDDFTAARLAEG
ncbi:MAG TPA: hypothetical protein VGP94_02790, partial [Tepidisphaeraceae bacterium]|nr:hypothetical protein [Tepidisphaeraceae bacterium]